MSFVPNTRLGSGQDPDGVPAGRAHRHAWSGATGKPRVASGRRQASCRHPDRQRSAVSMALRSRRSPPKRGWTPARAARSGPSSARAGAPATHRPARHRPRRDRRRRAGRRAPRGDRRPTTAQGFGSRCCWRSAPGSGEDSSPVAADQPRAAPRSRQGSRSPPSGSLLPREGHARAERRASPDSITGPEAAVSM